MLIPILFSLLSLFGAALADHPVSLVIESNDQATNGLNVSSFYEAPSFNFLFLGSNGDTFQYSDSRSTVYLPNNVTGAHYNLTVLPLTSEVAISAIGGTPLTVRDNHLQINGSSTFYAVKNTQYDPVGYSKHAYQLVAARQNGSSEVRVRVVDSNVGSPGKPTVLITGAGSGFGKNSSFILARQGYNVIASVETTHEVHDLRRQVGEQDLPITVRKLDITDEADRIRAASWDVDILVNNAGIGEGGAVIDIPENRLRRQFEVNVFGTILLTQKIARNFVKRGSGTIVIVSSVAGLTTDPFAGAYSSSKHALEAFADALNQELREYGVKIATVNPGPILTGYNDRLFETHEFWYPEDQDRSLFDYSKLSFPHQQYDPAQVSELIAEVVNGSVTTYRNVVPKEIQSQQRQMMNEVWTRQIHTDTNRAPLVQAAYDIYPGTFIGR